MNTVWYGAADQGQSVQANAKAKANAKANAQDQVLLSVLPSHLLTYPSTLGFICIAQYSIVYRLLIFLPSLLLINLWKCFTIHSIFRSALGLALDLGLDLGLDLSIISSFDFSLNLCSSLSFGFTFRFILRFDFTFGFGFSSAKG